MAATATIDRRDGGRQRADPGADGLLLLRRWKDSFFGSHHVHGTEGVAFYTQHKTVTTRWPDAQESAVELGFPQNR